MGGAAGGDPRVLVARVAGVVGILAYVASYVANLQVPGYRDPLWLRAAISALIAAVVAATYVSAFVVARLPFFLRAVVYVVTVHDYLLLVWNQLDALQVIGTYLVLAAVVATSSIFVTRPRHLGQYLATVAVLSIVVALVVRSPRTAAPQFLIGIATFTALAYVAMRAHLGTLRRLEESEAQARAVLHAVPDVLVRIDRDAVVSAILGEARGELARRAGALVGRRLDDLFDSSDPDFAEFVRSDPPPGEVRSFNARVRRPDGDPLYVELRLAAGRLALLRDMTRERKLEERLRLADRLAAVGTLAAGLAHEINNPLSYVLSNLKFAGQQLRARAGAGGSDDDVEVASALDDARVGAERIGNIVRSLKDYARGPDTLELSADAAECVKNAVGVLETELKHKATVSIELEPMMPRLRAEPFRITQVLVNLVANALHSMPRRARALGHIRIRGWGGGGSATLEVADDGCGIRPADVGRIFDPFFTTRSPGQGTGLGLYVCHQIVHAFGGSIDVTSTEGIGTTFRVVLPTLEPAHAALSAGSGSGGP